MCDGHCGSINAVQNHIKLEKTDKRPINSAPYRAGPTARKQGINWMHTMDINRSTQTELASSLLRRLPQVEGIDDPGFVADTIQWRMFQLAWRTEGICDIDR